MEEIRVLGTFASYTDYKAAFDAEVRRTETGFVRIGYMLRIAEDTDILRESGYANMETFAEAEYRIDKSQASRFMNINRRFSADGYSDRLQERYEGYGVAKLGEMLTLSDEVIAALPAELSRAVIQEVKKEIKEEQKVTDLEVMMEGRNEAQAAITENLGRFMHQYIFDNPATLKRLCAATYAEEGQYKESIMDTLAPSGLGVQMARIQGTGKFMLSIKGKDLPMELLNVRTNEKEICTWDHMMQTLNQLIHNTDPEKCWEELYNGAYPPAEEEREAKRQKEAEKERQAEAKQKEEEAKEKQRIRQAEEQRIRKAEEKAKKEEEAKRQTETAKVAPVQPEIIPPPESPAAPVFTGINEPDDGHQMQIEEYPEYLPKDYIKCHDGTEVTERTGEAIWNQIREQVENLKKATEQSLDKLPPQSIIEMHRTSQQITENLEGLMNV